MVEIGKVRRDGEAGVELGLSRGCKSRRRQATIKTNRRHQVRRGYRTSPAIFRLSAWFFSRSPGDARLHKIGIIMCPTRAVGGEEIDHLTSNLYSSPFVDDAIVFDIRKVLEEHEDPLITQFSDRPRLFTLLRMLECDNNVLEEILSANVNDYCLPLNESIFKTLNALCNAKPWDEFRKAQRYLLSNPKLRSQESLDHNSQLHLHLENGKRTFKDEKELDNGGTATVFRVQLTTFDNPDKGRLYACKRLTRDKRNKQEKHLQPFMDELLILRKISHPDTVIHPHMVRLVASYTDLEDFALVLDPVADSSLKDVLHNPSTPLNLEISTNLRQWFGCLASALAYLHRQSIRHKDIKPGNILLHNRTVYLCDFGISFDWSGSHPTTEGPSAMTQGYCAPEVWYADARDNSSDVWSLGRVFCDMLTVLAGKPMTELSERIGGNLRRIYDEDCLEDLHKWLSGFSLENIRHDTLATNIQQLIKKMVSDHSSSQYCVCSQRSDVQGSKLAT
jgi:hypothetical protein